MLFNNDEFTSDIDELGYKPQADIIRKLIINSATPYSIGISGRWGSGKTSMMKYLMASLGGTTSVYRRFYGEAELIDRQEQAIFNKIKRNYNHDMPKVIPTIWFNPWEHENHDEPFIELLREIHHYFSSSVLEKAGKIAHSSIMAGLDMLGNFLKLGNNPASHIQSLGEQYEKSNFQQIHRSQQFKLIFQTAIKKLLQGCGAEDKDKQARLVIFIDDLDRCENDQIVRLLKDIKQHLTSQHCVFVFGYDRYHIEEAMSHSQRCDNKNSRAYLEKLFQSTVYIKQPNQVKLTSFITKYTKSLLTELKQTPKKPTQYAIEISHFITEIIDPNPRRIKAFFNASYLHIASSECYINRQTPLEIDDLKKLLLLAYLKLFYEPVYSALENKTDLLPQLLEVYGYKDPAKIQDYQQAFLYLETKGHLNNVTIFDDENQLAQRILKDKDSENKFLSEVHEMQGKHQTYGKFMSEFIRLFSSSEQLLKYL